MQWKITTRTHTHTHNGCCSILLVNVMHLKLSLLLSSYTFLMCAVTCIFAIFKFKCSWTECILLRCISDCPNIGFCAEHIWAQFQVAATKANLDHRRHLNSKKIAANRIVVDYFAWNSFHPKWLLSKCVLAKVFVWEIETCNKFRFYYICIEFGFKK